MKTVFDRVHPDRQHMRDRKLAELGPRPPRWRPFARRRWAREHAAIMAIDVSEFAAMLAHYYDVGLVTELAERPRPAFVGYTVKRLP